MISSPGIGSGIDTGSIVQQLVALERQPIDRLFVQEAQISAQLSAFGQIKSVLSDFQSSLSSLNELDDFTVLKASSSNQDVLTVSAASNASPGVFNLTVDRVAENHRTGSQNTFADVDSTTIGTAGDVLTITVGTDSFDVEYGGLTLGEIRDAINSATANSGVTASILKDDLGNRLLLNADETGSDNFLSFSFNNSDPFNFIDLNSDRDGVSGFSSADLDAVIQVDGQFTSTQTRNTVTDLIAGVTLTLADAGDSLVEIEPDEVAVQSAVENFVDSYNTALKTIRELRETSLSSDVVTLVALENQIRNAVNTSISNGGSFESIYQIGVSSTFVFGAESTSNGQLNVDSTELLQAIQQDSDSIANLFADPSNGLIVRLENVVDQLVKSDGLIDGKTESLNLRIDNIVDRRDAMELRLVQYEQRLLDQFNSLDTVVSQLRLTGDFLTQQLAVLQPVQSNN
ncbi:MAG: flagellar filament capping protein FliD [Pseudomonadota bacterium]